MGCPTRRERGQTTCLKRKERQCVHETPGRTRRVMADSTMCGARSVGVPPEGWRVRSAQAATARHDVHERLRSISRQSKIIHTRRPQSPPSIVPSNLRWWQTPDGNCPASKAAVVSCKNKKKRKKRLLHQSSIQSLERLSKLHPPSLSISLSGPTRSPPSYAHSCLLCLSLPLQRGKKTPMRHL